MEQSSQMVSIEKPKKTALLKSFLDCKRIDKKKIQEYFLENFSNIPQELRLIFWKIALGIYSPFCEQNSSVDKLLHEHHIYLKHIIENVFELKTNNEEELNYYVYLLDKDFLPIKDFKESSKYESSFILIYRQINEILDDQSEFESYYLTVEIYENLKNNLKIMTEKFNNFLTDETLNKQMIENINIEPFLKCGLAGFFRDLKLYHIIWDRLVMGEYEMLIYSLVSFLESCKEEQLKILKSIELHQFNSISSTFALDELKILKRITKYYRCFNPNNLVSDLILKYFSNK